MDDGSRELLADLNRDASSQAAWSRVPCPECGQRFEDFESVDAHLRQDHLWDDEDFQEMREAA